MMSPEEAVWLLAEMSQWMFWAANFWWWFLYNIGVPGTDMLAFTTWTNPILGLTVSSMHLLILYVHEDVDMTEWEGVFGAHIALLISMWLKRNDMLDFLHLNAQMTSEELEPYGGPYDDEVKQENYDENDNEEAWEWEDEAWEDATWDIIWDEITK